MYEEKHREHLEHLDGEYNQAGSRKYLRETLAITEIIAVTPLKANSILSCYCTCTRTIFECTYVSFSQLLGSHLAK